MLSLNPTLKSADSSLLFPISSGSHPGDTEQQAVEMAVDALEMIVRDYMERGKPIPDPSKVRGRECRVIRLPGLQSVKVELYNAFLASGMRKADLARRLKIPSPNIDRLFSLDHQSRLDQLEAAFSANN
jgi:antitoxin HicB